MTGKISVGQFEVKGLSNSTLRKDVSFHLKAIFEENGIEAPVSSEDIEISGTDQFGAVELVVVGLGLFISGVLTGAGKKTGEYIAEELRDRLSKQSGIDKKE